ncbi:MAG: phosphoglycerate dehydrogenase [Candidatus Omnitrophica bacterium]|nr:phosphoglycerate dehydrogenase [Candidatus Omnitrophota bacterium]
MKPLSKEKVLIGPSTFCAVDKEPLERLRKTGCVILDNPFKRKLTKDELVTLLSNGITGIIAGLEPLDREVLGKSALKVISRCGAGLSNIDLEAARELKIKICATPDAPTTAVAELTVGALLSMLRMLPQMDRDLHEGRWSKKIGAQLEGKTVLIIGLGRIGKRVADLLASFNVRIIAADPVRNKAEKGIEILPLDRALREADIITIHASGNDRIIGKDEFKIIKKGAYLLNASRGNVIDEVSLIRALEEGGISGAWLDTFDTEPYNGPLTKYPQVILTPHAGSYTAECRKVMEMQAVDNLIAAFCKIGK